MSRLPMSARWTCAGAGRFRAGAVTSLQVVIENAGSVSWVEEGRPVVSASYHWRDLRGNTILHEGLRTPLGGVEAGDARSLAMPVRAPIPPGLYELALDLVSEARFWFGELGEPGPCLRVEVEPRVSSTPAIALLFTEGPSGFADVTRTAVAAQAHLVDDPVHSELVAYFAPGCLPAPNWASYVVDAHREGFGVVAGAVALRRSRLRRSAIERELEPWRPGRGRVPGWMLPLLCPTVVREAVDGLPWIPPLHGLPAVDGRHLVEPWIFDGRIETELPAQADRP